MSVLCLCVVCVGVCVCKYIHIQTRHNTDSGLWVAVFTKSLCVDGQQDVCLPDDGASRGFCAPDPEKNSSYFSVSVDNARAGGRSYSVKVQREEESSAAMELNSEEPVTSGNIPG